MLKGITNVSVYLDDILLSSSSRNEHQCTLQNVLERLSKHGVHLQKINVILKY